MIHHETVGKCTRQTGRDVGSWGKRTHLYKVKTRNVYIEWRYLNDQSDDFTYLDV